MIKYVCDGCNRELRSDSESLRVWVDDKHAVKLHRSLKKTASLQSSSGFAGAIDRTHLCFTCLRRMLFLSKGWRDAVEADEDQEDLEASRLALLDPGRVTDGGRKARRTPSRIYMMVDVTDK